MIDFSWQIVEQWFVYKCWFPRVYFMTQIISIIRNNFHTKKKIQLIRSCDSHWQQSKRLHSNLRVNYHRTWTEAEAVIRTHQVWFAFVPVLSISLFHLWQIITNPFPWLLESWARHRMFDAKITSPEQQHCMCRARNIDKQDGIMKQSERKKTDLIFICMIGFRCSLRSVKIQLTLYFMLIYFFLSHQIQTERKLIIHVKRSEIHT